MEERELIREVQEGNMQAFEQLFERYKYKAMRTAYLMTGDKYTSEDIVQEAFTTCYLSIKSLKSPEYFKTWFFKLLTRIAWRYMKKEKTLIPIEAINKVIESGQDLTAPNEIEQREAKNAVYKEIMKLDYKLQTTIILYYYNELSIKEIAKVMGCLEGTVKSRLHTARKKLKVSLLEESSMEREAFGI